MPRQRRAESDVDFELDEQLQLVRETARAFAEAEVAPTADRRDREHAFPRKEFDAAAELGFAGMLVPEDLGGTALGTLALALVIEELSRACASTGVTISVHNSLVCSPVLRHGTPEQKRQWLPRLASGELLGAYALSEANAGSDAASLQCKARLDGDTWVLTGSKLWITSGNEADLVIVFARAPEGVTAFVVLTDSPGFSVGKVEEKLGIRSSSTVELVLDGVRVPQDRLLGTLGKGLTVAFDTLDGGRIGIAAQALGIAQASLDASLKYAGQREQFGTAIGRFQAVQFKIAQVSAELAGARLMTWRAAMLRDQGRPHTLEAAQAKLFASQVANRAADEAVQIHGGAGYTTEFPVARYFRDARITEIYEGTSEIQRIVIARKLLAGT
jgi:butyryl-CoA dehydrogenase